MSLCGLWTSSFQHHILLLLVTEFYNRKSQFSNYVAMLNSSTLSHGYSLWLIRSLRVADVVVAGMVQTLSTNLTLVSCDSDLRLPDPQKT